MGSDERSTIFPVSLLLLLRDVNDFLRAYIYICNETADVLPRPRKLADIQG